jgi:hypothetical protein
LIENHLKDWCENHKVKLILKAAGQKLV